jgi:hypothetical protein
MKRLLFVPFAIAAAFGVAPAASAAPAFHAECTRFPGAFPGATGGEIIINAGGILANCQYPGPAEGGGAEFYQGCVIAAAGNFQCPANLGGPEG